MAHLTMKKMHSSGSHLEKNNIEPLFSNSKKPNPYLTSPSSSAYNVTSHPQQRKTK